MRNRKQKLSEKIVLLLILQRCQQLLEADKQMATPKKRIRRWWVRPAWQKRKQQFYTLYPAPQTSDSEMFFR